MTIRNETQTVKVGDCIFIPSNEPHRLVNGGNEKLINLWPLQSEEENK